MSNIIGDKWSVRYDESADTFEVVADAEFEYAGEHQFFSVADISCHIDGEAEAHAYMVAAAPIMLSALRQIVDMNVQYAIDKYGDASKAEEMSCVIVARAAIAKAEERHAEG